MDPKFVFFCIWLCTLPALWTICNAGEQQVTPQDVPTPDTELRQNEGVALKTDDEVIQREEERISSEGFSVKERKLLEEQAEKFAFQAEVNRLMHIIIHSLYSNREVFLRELISNASDALDKIRFLSLTDKAQLDSGSNLEIKIKADKENNILYITDTGIGMTKEELIGNLGTIAKTGTTEFLEKFKEGSGDAALIGQFGVGFYSAFLVADKVTVISKHNSSDKQYVWESNAAGDFTVAEDPRGNTLSRGTQIALSIKDDAKEFLEPKHLESLVKKYSEFINFPIYLWQSHEEEKEVSLTEEEIKAEKEKKLKEKKEAQKEEGEEEIDLDEQTDETAEEDIEVPTTKKVKETVWTWELMNETKPLWTRKPADITQEEYNNFYKAFSKDDKDPLMHIHFLAEGEVEFKSLLFVPGTAPNNMFDPNPENQHKGIKLYVRRVFITDEFKDILPKYLSFVKGLVDSDDLPLNVSREMLQEHKTLKIIKKKLIRKAIAMFQQLSEEEDSSKYLEFWKNYGTNLKLGIIEDGNNRLRLSKLLMFYSSKTGELTTFDKYVSRMKEGQNQIYYLGGESKAVVEKSPLLEKLVKKGYEVLYMVDPIDEYALSHLEKFDGKYKLTNIAREGVTLDGEEKDEEKEKQQQEELKPVVDFLKKELGSKIEKVVVSNRLTQSPSALVAGSYGWTANMERIVRAQALGDSAKQQQAFYSPKKIMEINPKHPIIQELKRRIEADEEDQTAKDTAGLLYETAAFTSGFSLDDPAAFAQRIVRFMNLGLNLDPNAAPEEEPEPVEPPKVEVEEPMVEEPIEENKDEL